MSQKSQENEGKHPAGDFAAYCRKREVDLSVFQSIYLSGVITMLKAKMVASYMVFQLVFFFCLLL